MEKNESIIAIQEILESIVMQMGVTVRVEVEEGEAGLVVFNVHTDETQTVIGRQGSVLHALQAVVQQIAVKRLGYGNIPHFSIDVDDYRRKRTWFLQEMTRQAIEKAKRTGQSVTLDPMPNYERRLVHTYIQEHFADVISESGGEGTSRRVTIRVAK